MAACQGSRSQPTERDQRSAGALRTMTYPGSLKRQSHQARRGREGQEESACSPPHHHLLSKACTGQWPVKGQVTSSCRGQSALKASVPKKSIREATRPWGSKLQEPPAPPNPRLGVWQTSVKIHVCEKPSPALTSQLGPYLQK